jgi:3,4-dihydroxy 2-butanone 4-phosphate synthase/GTP cyclohydrolase II
MTGDVFGSSRCDCGEQLNESMRRIAQEGGVLLYLRQEGRGIGLINKMKAYNLQDQGLNTADANVHLGFDVDPRDYSIAVHILRDLGIRSARLMTNNPEKVRAFDDSAIQIIERVPLIIPPGKENVHYLKTKRDVLGHALDLETPVARYLD